MIWIILVIVGILVLILSGCKSNPDPHFHRWQLVDKTTERWKNYCDYMKRITSDALLAAELQKEVLVNGVWKKFYKWVSDWDLFNKLDYWDLPDEVWFRGLCDCDGFARFVCDVIGRFIMLIQKSITGVWWLEYYGFYRKYSSNGEYKIIAGGHAICVYRKNGELFAFSNTSWWNHYNFKDFIEIGEMTFPEGIYWVICRQWEDGKMEWQMKAEPGEIMEGTNIFHRRLKIIKNLKHLKKGEKKKIIKQLEKGKC
ncbi:hypothetical protein ES705_16714 [subsurface metagenome]